MLDETDRYWGGSRGRSWNDLPRIIRQLKLPNLRHSEAVQDASDRIPRDEVAESNALMERLGLRTRYLPDGQAYQIQGRNA